MYAEFAGPNYTNELRNLSDKGWAIFRNRPPFLVNPDRLYLFVKDDEYSHRIIGICCVNPNTLKGPNAIGIGYIDVHADYRNQGVGKLLVRALMQYAQKSGKAVYPGFYEPMGELYIKHVIERIANEYGVEVR